MQLGPQYQGTAKSYPGGVFKPKRRQAIDDLRKPFAPVGASRKLLHFRKDKPASGFFKHFKQVVEDGVLVWVVAIESRDVYTSSRGNRIGVQSFQPLFPEYVERCFPDFRHSRFA